MQQNMNNPTSHPYCIWLTGFSGAGKSTLAQAIQHQLTERGERAYILDGDSVRNGLNKDLGFSVIDRRENIRRIAEVARLMVDAGLIVIVAFISPFRKDRAMARALFDHHAFVEVFVDAPLAVCEQRDVKGLYHRARQGQLDDFTGISSPYEIPHQPEVHLQTHIETVPACVQRILNKLFEQHP